MEVKKLLVTFEGTLKSTSQTYQKKLTTIQMLYYQHMSVDKLHKKVSSWITSSNELLTCDMKIFMSIKFSIYEISVLRFKKLIEQCQCSRQNAFLLEAYAYMTYAYIHLYYGDHEKASTLIDHAKISCFEAAPSYLTCWACYADAVIQGRAHEKNLTPSVKERIVRLFDLAIVHSYFSEGWERSMVCFCHIRKTLFLLGGTTKWLEFNPKNTPTEKDMQCAGQHLNALPPELLKEFFLMTQITVEYHVALSDFNRLRGDTMTAREHARVAKQLYANIGKSHQGIEDRILYKHPLDDLLC